MKKILYIAMMTIFSLANLPVKSQDIILPSPVRSGGMPLMQALNERKSIREFDAANLSQQQLSDMLWAACGYNRPAQKMRTAPSARNIQEIDVYAALQTGLYLYEPATHSLKQIAGEDIRSLTGSQPFVGGAAVNLVYVADMAKLGKKEGDEIKDSDLLWPYANTGYISQNVYLYCASENLGSVVRGMIPKDKLAPAMKLRSNQVIVLTQTVGVIK